MIALASRHPALLALGLIKLALELAIKRRHESLAVLMEMALKAARQNRDVVREIACDADRGVMAVRELLGDGHASEADQAQLFLIFSEIRTEAVEGRIIA